MTDPLAAVTTAHDAVVEARAQLATATAALNAAVDAAMTAGISGPKIGEKIGVSGGRVRTMRVEHRTAVDGD